MCINQELIRPSGFKSWTQLPPTLNVNKTSELQTVQVENVLHWNAGGRLLIYAQSWFMRTDCCLQGQVAILACGFNQNGKWSGFCYTASWYDVLRFSEACNVMIWHYDVMVPSDVRKPCRQHYSLDKPFVFLGIISARKPGVVLCMWFRWTHTLFSEVGTLMLQSNF